MKASRGFRHDLSRFRPAELLRHFNIVGLKLWMANISLQYPVILYLTHANRSINHVVIRVFKLQSNKAHAWKTFCLSLFCYLREPLWIPRVTGHELHQPLEAIINGGFCQCCFIKVMYVKFSQFIKICVKEESVCMHCKTYTHTGNISLHTYEMNKRESKLTTDNNFFSLNTVLLF